MQRVTVLIATSCITLAATWSVYMNSYNAEPSWQHLKSSFHVCPENNWANDPNGPIYWNGAHHLFFQHVHTKPAFSAPDMSWGHAVSYDNMVHWKRLPVALKPSSAVDALGVYTGSAFLHPTQHVPWIIYTGNQKNNEQQCLAMPNDPNRDVDLKAWTKYEHNPVIEGPFGRDPTGIRPGREPGSWFVQYGGANNKKQGIIHLKRAVDNNLFHWKDEGYFYEPASSVCGFFECPDVFEFPDHPGVYGVKVSCGVDMWAVGHLSDDLRRFEPVTPLSHSRLIDYGPECYYASKTMYDPVGKRQVIFAWIKEQDRSFGKRGWAGLQSIPRIVELDARGTGMLFRPLPELVQLRMFSTQVDLVSPTLDSSTTASYLIDDVEFDVVPQHGHATPDQLEVFMTLHFTKGFNLAGGEELDVSVRVLQSPDKKKFTTIGFQNRSGSRLCVYIDRSKSSVRGDVDRKLAKAEIGFERDGVEVLEELVLHIFIDHSVVEVFTGDGRMSMSARVYPDEKVGDESDATVIVGKVPKYCKGHIATHTLDTIWRDVTSASETDADVSTSKEDTDRPSVEII